MRGCLWRRLVSSAVERKGDTGRLTAGIKVYPAICLALWLLAACSWPPVTPTTAPHVQPSASATPVPAETSPPTSQPTTVPTTRPTLSPTPSSTPLPSPTPLPLDEAGLLLRGDALRADGDYESALRLYQEALARYEDTPPGDEARLRVARVYLEMGQSLSTTAVLSPVLDLLPPGPRQRAHFLMAEAFYQLGDCGQSSSYYLAFREAGTTLDDLVAERLAWCYRALGDHVLAAEEFTRAAGPYRDPSDQVWMLDEAARDLRDLGDYDQALSRYERILALASKPWYRASILYKVGETLQEAGRPDEALERWQEILTSYSDTETAAWAADNLLYADVSVDPYHVAQAYRAAGRRGEALAWFEEALAQGVDSPDEVRYALAQTRAEVGDLDGALLELAAIFEGNPADPQPLMEQGRILGEYGFISRALEVYNRLGQQFPDTPEAGEALWRSGNLLEAQRHDDEAVDVYVTLLESYPDHELAAEARFRAGMLRYRGERFAEAAALWGGGAGTGDSRLVLWWGLALAQAGQDEDAGRAWEEAAAGEDYYAARARELLSGGKQLGDFVEWPTWEDEAEERSAAEQWLASYWGQPFSGTLSDDVQVDPLFSRGEELLALGFEDEAREPFTLLIERFRDDAPSLYALSLYLRQQRLYGVSVRSARRIVQLADLSQEDTPVFLLRLIYPTPYAQLIVPHAQANNVDPLLFFALVRQESLFDRHATSWAEARGLTQVIPSTGQWIAEYLGVYPFRLEDLYRPVISVRFGAWYLGQQVLSFEGQAIPALAAYNGGPGNALRWAGQVTPVSDLDLFVETIDFTETRDYIERVYTSYWIYRQLYGGE